MFKKLSKKVAKTFLACCCAFSIVPIQGLSVVNAKETAITIDDTDSSFVYSNGNANNGGWDAGGGNTPDQTEHWTNTPNANFTLTFQGTKLELYGKKAPNHRYFSVSIDGGTEEKFDAYASEKTDNNQILYSSKELNKGEHTAVVTLLDEANPAAQNALGMNIAYAKVYGAEEEKPEFPGYSEIEDVNTTTSNEPFKIKYNGEWSGGTSYYPQFHDGYEHYADNGSSYEIIFTGTKIEIYASVDPNHGIYDVTIDGKPAGKANATADQRKDQVCIFSVDNLENKEHVMKVELKNQEDKSIQLDYLKIYHEEILPDSISLNKEEIYIAPGGSYQLTATIEPWVASNQNILWESSNEDLLTVQDGKIIAKEVTEKTEVTVTAKAAANPNAVAEANVIIDPSIALLNVTVGDEKLLDTEEDYEKLSSQHITEFKTTAWKDDQINSKIVVATKDKEIKNVEVSASDFVDEKGNILSKENIDIKWLKEVTANIGRGTPSAPKKQFPEIIHKGGKKDIQAQDVAFAWTSIHIPKTTPAGTYTGTITVTADDLKQPIELIYTIEILNLVQPELEQTEIQIWQHPFAVANYYLGLGSQPEGGISNEIREDFYFSEEHLNLMRASMEEYASIGGHDAVANIVEEAWNHQSYYNDLSMVKWTKKKDGTWNFDYTWYDKWIEFMISCGVLNPEENIGQIKCYSIVPWNNQIAYYDEASNTIKKESHKPGTDSWKAMWVPFLEDFMNHSKEKGWFDITYISMDERELEELKPAVELIESIKDEDGNHFKISSALNYSAPEYYDFTDRIDDISINLGNTKNIEQMKNLTEHRKEKKLTTTYYTCTGDNPSNYTISDPGDNYWTLWYTMTLGTDGYMRWAWDNYVYDMHNDISYRYWEPGDGWYIYPMERDEIDSSQTVGFYSTPRYELFKQGIRDVAKAKYLLSSPNTNTEQKKELSDVVENLNRPNNKTEYGSAVPATEEDRMLVHSETKRAINKTNEIARKVSSKLTAKETLESTLENASKLNKNEYTNDSWANFEIVLNEAKNLITTAEATEKDYINMNTKLLQAINNLVKVPSNMVNKDNLAELIEKAESLDKELYTASSWNNLSKVLKEAKNIYNDKNATQEQIDKIEKELSAAIDKLELIKPNPEEPESPEEPNYSEDKTDTENNNTANTENDNTVNTGNNISTVSWTIGLGLSAATIIYLRRKKKQSTN